MIPICLLHDPARVLCAKREGYRATVLYKCTDYYRPEFERTLNWADPTLAIAWPLRENQPLILSDKDRQAPLFTL